MESSTLESRRRSESNWIAPGISAVIAFFVLAFFGWVFFVSTLCHAAKPEYRMYGKLQYSKNTEYSELSFDEHTIPVQSLLVRGKPESVIRISGYVRGVKTYLWVNSRQVKVSPNGFFDFPFAVRKKVTDLIFQTESKTGLKKLHRIRITLQQEKWIHTDWMRFVQFGPRLMSHYTLKENSGFPEKALLAEFQFGFEYRNWLSLYLTAGHSFAFASRYFLGGGTKMTFLRLSGIDGESLKMNAIGDLVYYPVEETLGYPENTASPRFGVSLTLGLGSPFYYLEAAGMISVVSSAFFVAPQLALGYRF